MIKEDLQKYLTQNFLPLKEYLQKLENSISTRISFKTIKESIYLEYQTNQELILKIYITTIYHNQFISFNFYNQIGEHLEKIDFLLADKTNKYLNQNQIRYSAYIYENNLIKIVNSVYSYKDNQLVSGFRDKSILSPELGHYLLNISQLQDLHCQLKKHKLKCLSKSREYLTPNHQLELYC